LRVIQVLKDQETFEVQRAKEEGREPSVYHGLFSTHPDNDQRLKEVVGAAKQFASPNATADNSHEFLTQLEGLTFGDGERDGVRRGNRFYHGALNFALEFPTGWRIDNGADRLLAQSRGGEGLLQFTLQDRNKKNSPEDFLRAQLGVNLRQGEAIQHAGMPGYTALAEQKTPFGQLPVRYVVLFRDQQALLFAGLSKAKNQPYKYDALVLQTVRSFHPLSESERALARAQRLHLIHASATTRFATLARESTLPDAAEARLRLLNGRYPNGEPAPGEILKIVR
jgi:predicted Zn-dependent protease